MLVYLDGSYVPSGEAKASVDDRGFLFADGVYEVTRIYDGRSFLMQAHIDRMRRGLGELSIDFDVDELEPIAERLLDENGVRAVDGIVYIQVTRGAAPRKHAFPDPGTTSPTVYMLAKPHPRPEEETFRRGVGAITMGDTRWSRCDIKSIALLPNVLANQRAHAEGVFEALFVRDGVVLEGSHSNLFAVYGDELLTYPASNYILPGITRGLVLEMAAELEIPARQGAILEERLFDADELFLSGTTTEVMPVVEVDGRRIGAGEPGPVTRRLIEAYNERI